MRRATNDSEGHYGTFPLKGEAQSIAAKGCRRCMWIDAKNARVRECVPKSEAWMLFIRGWEQLFWLLIFSSNCFDQNDFHKCLCVHLSDLCTFKFQRKSWKTKGSRNQTTPPTNFLTGTCLLKTKNQLSINPCRQVTYGWLTVSSKDQAPESLSPQDPTTRTHWLYLIQIPHNQPRIEFGLFCMCLRPTRSWCSRIPLGFTEFCLLCFY